MNLRGKRVFTGRMQLVNDWEVRPFAIQNPEGDFVPGFSARKHRAGEGAGKQYCFDERCMNREEAFAFAMNQGLCMLAGS